MGDLIQLESLPVEALAEMANEAAAACEASGRKTVEHAIRCGRALLAIRPQIPHGEWLSWLANNFSQSQSRASQYMSIANYYARNNLEAAETIQGALRMIADTPERQAKKLEREAKKQEQQPQKAEAPPKPPAPTPAPPAKPERPAWLADPDELDRPEEDDLPPLPRTNTHHTAANRRTPDARETDRAGLVSPDDPRELQDGHWYQWSEDANRLFAVTNEQILQAAALLRVAESVVVAPAGPADEPKPGKLPTLSQLRKAIDAQTGWGEALRQAANDWAAYKMSLAGKEKIRSMDSWKKALVRMGNVAKSQSVSVVCEAVEKAIANGWTGWEHLDRLKGSPAQLRTQAAGTEDFGISYEVVE